LWLLYWIASKGLFVRAAGSNAVAIALILYVAACGLEASDPNPEGHIESATVSEVSPPPPAAAIPSPPREEDRRRPDWPRVEQSDDGLVSHSGSQTPPDLLAVHLAEVGRIKGDDERADYPPAYDHWHEIDLDSDGRDERLVFFTVEGFGGGNNYSRYLIVYRYIEPVWFASDVIGVGGKWDYAVLGDVVRLSNQMLTVGAKFYDDQDGSCCPSIEADIAFRVLAGGRLEPSISEELVDAVGERLLFYTLEHAQDEEN
jgi:hypothetical protein